MKFIFSILFSIVFLTAASAQSNSHEEKMKKIEALKAAFITKKLDLTPEESQRFWPVYNEYQKTLSELYRKKRQNYTREGGIPKKNLTDDLDIDTKILNTRKKYRDEFSKVLPSSKVTALSQAEREFREELIKELGERRRHR